MDIPDFNQWIGRTESRQDEVTAAPVRALSATLDRDDPEPKPGDALPPLWHWLYFLPHDRASELAEDGHAKRGGFLPPVPLPRRMWAGSRLEFLAPIRIGERITRVSRIQSVKQKEGRSGPLVFVTVRHETANAQGPAIAEEHDIVYRGHATVPAEPQPTRRDHAWERMIRADDVLLFRYSALTFNGHRIHYDRRYATGTEGYAGLVVHGPLIATLLLDLLRRESPVSEVAKFSFRAVSPLFDAGPFFVCGRPEGESVSLWARNALDGLAMDARALLR